MNKSVPHPIYVTAGVCPYSIKGWVINSDENSFFDGSCQILKFSAHNAEVINRYIMTSGLMIVMDG